MVKVAVKERWEVTQKLGVGDQLQRQLPVRCNLGGDDAYVRQVASCFVWFHYFNG